MTSSIALAPGASVWEDASEPAPDWDLLGKPEPDIEFEQRVAW
ncbi:MAG: hypothetical protein WBM40_15710 [Thiohalocapsa sp.]